MKTIAAMILLAVLPTFAGACDLSAGPGKVVRLGDGSGSPGGFATVACVFRDRWEVRAWWFGEQRIYDETVTIDAFPALTVQRLWEFREGRRVRPVLGMGAMVKGAQRCHYDGDLDCNRMLPLPYAFFFSAGLVFGDSLRLSAGHASNDSMDWGPEKKNQSVNGLWLEASL